VLTSIGLDILDEKSLLIWLLVVSFYFWASNYILHKDTFSQNIFKKQQPFIGNTKKKVWKI
jgi:hypothetical protein